MRKPSPAPAVSNINRKNLFGRGQEQDTLSAPPGWLAGLPALALVPFPSPAVQGPQRETKRRCILD